MFDNKQSVCCFLISIKTTVTNSYMQILISIQQPLACVKTEALHENSTKWCSTSDQMINLDALRITMANHQGKEKLLQILLHLILYY